jgi:uncharacterized protein YeaO (DUF488 family)
LAKDVTQAMLHATTADQTGVVCTYAPTAAAASCCDSAKVSIRLKRVYDKPAIADGRRVLVDRLWPRGLTKGEAQIHEWLKEIAPSTALRKWYEHDPAKWKEFTNKYAAELDARREQVEQLLRDAKRRRVTLLFSAKDTKHNNAVALKEYMEEMM